MQQSVGGLHLLGVRRHLAEVTSRTDGSNSSSVLTVAKPQRSLLESVSYSTSEINILVEGNERPLALAAESRKELVNAFYNLLHDLVPGFAVEEIGAVPQSAIDYLCTHLSDKVFEVLGDGGFILFRAHEMQGTEDAVLFRGDIDGVTFDVLVNCIKAKPLLRLLERPSRSIQQISQTLVLLNPRILSQRLVIPSAILMITD